MTINMPGIDSAKSTIQPHGTDNSGKTVYERRLAPRELAAHVANIPTCTIVMEACGGAIIVTGKAIRRWCVMRKFGASNPMNRRGWANGNSRQDGITVGYCAPEREVLLAEANTVCEDKFDTAYAEPKTASA